MEAGYRARAARLLEEANDQLECSVCLEEYVDPRSLVCSHTFCMECITHIAKDHWLDTGRSNRIETYIICPECREWTILRMNQTLRDLPRPLFLRRFTELRDRLKEETAPPPPPPPPARGSPPSATDTCDMCRHSDKTADATGHCRNCQLNYCRRCLRQHAENKAFTDHVVVVVTGADVTQTMCDVHAGRPCTSYCVTCRTSLCAMCVLGFHDREHEIQDLKHVINDVDERGVRFSKLSASHGGLGETATGTGPSGSTGESPEQDEWSQEWVECDAAGNPILDSDAAAIDCAIDNIVAAGGDGDAGRLECGQHLESKQAGGAVQEETPESDDVFRESITPGQAVASRPTSLNCAENTQTRSDSYRSPVDDDTVNRQEVREERAEMVEDPDGRRRHMYQSQTLSQEQSSASGKRFVTQTRVVLRSSQSGQSQEGHGHSSPPKSPTREEPKRSKSSPRGYHRSGSREIKIHVEQSPSRDMARDEVFKSAERGQMFRGSSSSISSVESASSHSQTRASLAGSRSMSSANVSSRSSWGRSQSWSVDNNLNLTSPVQDLPFDPSSFAAASSPEPERKLSSSSSQGSSSSRSKRLSYGRSVSVDLEPPKLEPVEFAAEENAAPMARRPLHLDLDTTSSTRSLDTTSPSCTRPTQLNSDTTSPTHVGPGRQQSLDTTSPTRTHPRRQLSLDTTATSPARSRLSFDATYTSPNVDGISPTRCRAEPRRSLDQSHLTEPLTPPAAQPPSPASRYTPPAVARISAIRPLGVTNGIAWDGNLRLVVSTTSVSEPVQVFDYQGEKIHSYGRGVLMSAHGVCVDAHGRTAVVDRMMKCIKIFDSSTGSLVQTVKDRDFKGVMHVALAKDGPDGGNVLAITDRVADCVFLYDMRAEKVLRKIGDNSGDRKWGPTEIACGRDPHVLHVRDNVNTCVKSFDMRGGDITDRIDTGGRYGNWCPKGVAVDTRGSLLVADWNSRKILTQAADRCECFYSLSGVGRPYSVVTATGLMATAIAKRYDGDIVKESDIEIYSVKH